MKTMEDVAARFPVHSDVRVRNFGGLSGASGVVEGLRAGKVTGRIYVLVAVAGLRRVALLPDELEVIVSNDDNVPQ